MESGLLFAYVGLGALAVLPIVLGSIASLQEKKSGSKDAERMGADDAYMFPVIGSVTLFTFYLLFKHFNPVYINLLLTAYFSFFGIYALSALVQQVAGMLLPEKMVKYGQFWMNIGGTEEKPRWKVELSVLRALSWVIAAGITAGYVFGGKHWILSNVIGLAFATSAISLIHLDSFKTGVILLAGLFLYDIFWVFGTKVMVSVAKSFDVPVKLLFPKNLGYFYGKEKAEFCLLGLGDIVIPGVFVALCHRFDDFAKKPSSFFRFALGFYVAGLATTMGVMHFFKAAQPALLYLSPACIVSVVICGLLNKNLDQVTSYSDDHHGILTTIDKKSAGKTSPKKSPKKSPLKSPVVEVITPRRRNVN